MEPNLSFLLLAVLCVASVAGVPLNDNNALQWASNACAKSCSPDATAFVRFLPQHSYVYRLETNTRIASPYGGQQDVRISADVSLTAHSHCDLALQLFGARVDGVDAETAAAFQRELEQWPLQFAYESGRVTGVCAADEEKQWALDVKKSVVSALQMSATSLTARSHVEESDISGQCDTEYEPMVAKYNQIVVRKTKRLNSCADRQSTVSALFPRLYGPQTPWPLTNGTLECALTLQSEAIEAVTCLERQTLFFSGVSLKSELNLRLKETLKDSLAVARLVRHRRHHLRMSRSDVFGAHKTYSESELMQIARNLCHQLSSDSTAEKTRTAETFAELVAALQSVSPSAVQRIQNADEMCAQSPQSFSDIMADAAAVAGSESSVDLLIRLSAKMSFARREYLFSQLSFASNPTPKAVQRLVEFFVSDKSLGKHAILGISGFIHNARHSNGPSVRQMASQALNALSERLNQKTQNSEIIALIKAIENIGPQESESARSALMRIARDSHYKDSARAAAVRAMTESMDSAKRREMIAIFGAKEESNELRIAAYKSVAMSGASAEEMREIRNQIQKESNEDIIEYVRSHQKNLLETSDPHKRYVRPQNGPQFGEPSAQWTGISRNFESSFLVDALGVGVAVEADVIHAKDERRVPRFLVANLTIPAFGSELQLLEIEFRQKGFEALIARQMQKMQRNSPKLVSDILEFVLSANEWTNRVSAAETELQIGVKVDGKTILLADIQDLRRDSGIRQHIERIADQLKSGVAMERAFGGQPVNTRVRLPNANGMPIEMRVNASFVSSVKSEAKLSERIVEAKVSPSLALQFEAGVAFAAHQQWKAVEAVVRVSANPVIDARADLRNGRSADVRINLPKEKQSLIRVESALYERQADGQRKRVSSAPSPRKHCSESTKRPFGFAVCYSSGQTSDSRLPVVFEATLEKSDRQMKGIAVWFETPDSYAADVQNYRIGFSTPQSSVDREVSAELQISRPSSARLDAKATLKSPWKRYSAQTSVRYEEKEQSVSVDVLADGQKAFGAEMALESQTRGQKREYRPRVRIAWPGVTPIEMQGSVAVAKGRKNQLQIQLEGNQKQFLKGSFVREGEKKSPEVRLSSDVSLLVPGLELRINGAADKASKHLTSDLTVEYRLWKGRKESVKVSAKVQNLTQSQMTKMSAFGEITCTQFPNANFHLAYNLLRKAREHLENELTVAWNSKLDAKVHALHVSRVTPSTQGNAFKVENTVSLEVTPLHVNYELRANADVDRNAKYSAQIVGKDKTGRTERDIRATVDYEHVSHAPLKLTMGATLRAFGREMAYKDSLEETASGVYAGKTSLQWAKGRKADLDYEYRIKSSPKEMHHEMDAQFKAADWLHPWRHSSLLKMSASALQLKSRVETNGRPLLDVDSLLSADAESRLSFETPAFASKASLDVYSVPQRADLHFSHPFSQTTHSSTVEFIPASALSLRSQTKRQQRDLFSIDGRLSRTTPSRLAIASAPFDGRLDVDVFSPKPAIQWEAKSATHDWKHSSQLAFEPNEYAFEMKSKTESKGKPLLLIDSQISPQKKSFASIDAPKYQTSVQWTGDLASKAKKARLEVVSADFDHKSEFEMSPKAIVVSAKSLQNREPIHDLDYDWNRVSGVHSIKTNFGRDYAFEGEGKHFWSTDESPIEPYVRFAAKAKDWESSARIAAQDSRRKMAIEANAKQQKRHLLDLTALLANDANAESSVRFQTPQIRAVVSGIPAKGAKAEWNCHHVSHVTSAQWPNGEYAFASQTQLKPNAVYELAAKHLLKESLISTKNPFFDSEVKYERQSSPRLSFRLDGQKSQLFPYSHESEVEIIPKQNTYRVKSRTESQNRQNIFSLDGQYFHERNDMPSQFDIKYGPQMTAKVRVQPFGGQKARQLWVEAKAPLFSHSTDVQFENHAIQWKSRTDSPSGENIAKIDSYLTANNGQKSHFAYVSPLTSADVEYSPRNSAKIEFSSPETNHKTRIAVKDNDSYELVSKTTHKSRNVLDIDSTIAPNGQKASYFYAKSDYPLDVELWGAPIEGAGRVGLKCAEFEHKTEVKIPSQKEIHFSTKTLRNDAILADIEAKLNAEQQKHSFAVEMPSFAAKSTLNWRQKAVNADFRSKVPKGRHILASIAANAGNGMRTEIAWDADRDANQRLELEWNHKRIAQSWGQSAYESSVSAKYAGNEVTFASQMTDDVWRGPHEWTVDYRPKYRAERDAMSLTLKHVIRGQEMQCNAVYSEGQALKFAAKVNAKVTPSGDGQEVVVSLETTAPKNPDLEVKVSFSERHSSLRRRNAQVFAELKAIRQSIGKQLVASARLLRDAEDAIRGSARFESPFGSERSLELAFEPQNKRLTASVTKESGKQWELMAKVGDTSAEVELKSNVESVPSVRASAQFVPQHSLALTVDADSARKLDFSVEKTGDALASGVQLVARFESSFAPKVESRNRVKFNSREVEFETNNKYDDRQQFAASLAAKRGPQDSWSGRGAIARNGAELASASLESAIGSYTFSAKSEGWEGAHVTLSTQSIGYYEKKAFLKLCRRNGDNCVDIKSDIIWKQTFPQKLWISLTKMGTNLELKTAFMDQMTDKDMNSESLLGVWSGKSAQKRIRNQILLSINSHSLGFDSIATARDRHYSAADASLKLFFPSNRWLQWVLDYDAHDAHSLRAKTRLTTDAALKPLFEAETRVLSDRQTSETKASLWMSSSKWKRQQKSVEVTFQPTNGDKVLAFKAVLDLSRDPNHAITAETQIMRRPLPAQSWTQSTRFNTTLEMTVFARDRRLLDVSTSAHFSPLSVGFLGQNVDRNGRQQSVFYFAQLMGEKRFEAVMRDMKSDYYLIGEYAKTDEEIAADIRLTNRKTNDEKETRFALNKKCLQIETKANSSLKKRIDFCLNTDHSNDKIVNLAIVSVDDRNKQQSVDFNLEVDTRAKRALTLDIHWTPELLQKALEWLQKSSLDSNYDSFYEELSAELAHKSALVSRHLSSELFVPIVSVVSDETYDTIQEFLKNFQMIPMIDEMREIAAKVDQKLTEIARKAYDWYAPIAYSTANAYRSVAQKARKACKRSDACFKALYALDNYGFDSLKDVFISAAKESHRLVVRSVDAMSAQWPRFVARMPDVVRRVGQYFGDYFDYFLRSNDSFRRFAEAVSRLIRELTKHSDIEWSAVRQSVYDMTDIAFGAEETRVVVWEPQKGRIQIEMREPAVRSRRLRAVASIADRLMPRQKSFVAKKWSQVKDFVKRMFK